MSAASLFEAHLTAYTVSAAGAVSLIHTATPCFPLQACLRMYDPAVTATGRLGSAELRGAG